MTTNVKPVNSQKPRGMVFYPRSYRINSDDAKSYSDGVDRNGNPCRVYLAPTIDPSTFTSSGQSLPTFARFSDRSRKAQHPCYAEEDNGPSNPAGVLLIEQVASAPAEAGQERVFSGRWASVLCETRQDTRPAIGLGYLEVNFNSKELVGLAELVNELGLTNREIEGGQGDRLQLLERRDFVAQEILRRRNKFFVAVLPQFAHTMAMVSDSKEAVASQLASVLNRFTGRGVYGGFIVRPRIGNGILAEMSVQIDMRYDSSAKRNATTEEVLTPFFRYNYPNLLGAQKSNPEMVLDVIPLTRINAGRVAGETLSKLFIAPAKDGNVVPDSKLLKHYIAKNRHNDPVTNYQKMQDYLCSHVAVRTATVKSGPGANNIIMASIHSYSPVIAPPLEIGPRGTKEYSPILTGESQSPGSTFTSQAYG